MRLKYRLKNYLKNISLAFYPATTLIFCAVAVVFLDILLGSLMMRAGKGTGWYDILFALMTGATASFIVSFAIELANNYKNNMLAWYELEDYFDTVLRYELTKHVHMKTTVHQRAEQKAIEEFKASGGHYEEDECDKVKDEIQSVWSQLPEIMPCLKETAENKKAFLTDGEIKVLCNILALHKEICHYVWMRIQKDLLHNTMNHPSEEFLKGIYPENIVNDMPDEVRRIIAGSESMKALDSVTDRVMADSFLLDHYMKDYDISVRGLAAWEEASDAESGDLKEEETDACDTSGTDKEAGGFGTESPGDDAFDAFYDDWEEMDEEAFIAMNREADEIMEREFRPFVSGQISRCCLEIGEAMDRLEAAIMKRPYVGLKMEWEKKEPGLDMKDPSIRLSYESTMKRLKEEDESQKAGREP